MKESPMTCPPHAPAGLKYNRGPRARFWVRTDSVSFRKLFAVHFAAMFDGVHAHAFLTAGYLGSFAFDWENPEHVYKLLVTTSAGKHSRYLFGSLLSEGSGEWLLCNQPDAATALLCDDAKYVSQRCLNDSGVKGNAGVYFISNGRGAVKIGKSGSCIQSRFISLQTASPDPLQIVAVIADPSPETLEADLHLRLANKRIRGEWFAMDDAEAVAIAIGHGGRAIAQFPS